MKKFFIDKQSSKSVRIVFDPAVRPNLHDVEARVGFAARLQPVKLRNAAIAAAFRLHNRLRRRTVRGGRARLYLHERQFLPVGHDEIRFPERGAVIFM